MNTPHNSKISLGKLETISPREAWADEARDFTPWLAEPENLSLLSETLGIDLELEAVEQSVGPFRADILCKQVGSEHWVLIENQLERTDHRHLGQVLTYAAGLDAVTVIWISPQFTEEHRACLDWLNRSTRDGFNFFGIQIELWRIGESSVAPRFNIVSKPNSWAENIATVSASLAATGRGAIHLKYWTAFMEKLKMSDSPIRPISPTSGNWLTFSPFGRTGFNLLVARNANKSHIRTGLYILPKNADQFYKTLLKMQPAIEEKLGSIVWHDQASQERAVLSYLETNPDDESDWPDQHQWLISRMNDFYNTFVPIVKTLEPTIYDDDTPVSED
jgi:hypothetical protein